MLAINLKFFFLNKYGPNKITWRPDWGQSSWGFCPTPTCSTLVLCIFLLRQGFTLFICKHWGGSGGVTALPASHTEMHMFPAVSRLRV